MPYDRPIQIEFNHCDPAGIVFYPRYFEMLNSTIENFFADVAGRSFARVIAGGNGSPTVRLEAQFRAPSRLGDRVTFRLRVTGVGRSSVDFAVDALGADGDLRVGFVSRLVWTDGLASAPWPDDIRANLLAAKERDTP